MNYLKQFFKTSTIRMVLFITFTSVSFSLLGQEVIIEESAQSFAELSFSENERLSKIQSKEMYTDYYLVEFGSLAEMQQDGKITIKLPESDCEELIYKARSVDYQSEQDYIWYGILESLAEEEECYCRLGSITLISSEFGKIGHISVDDKTYELLELSEGKFVLGKLDGSKFTEAECGVNDQTPIHETEENQSAQTRDNGNCDVRCLVLFTNSALNAEGNLAAINNRVNLAITQTNRALRNSDVDRCQLRIELAGVEPYILNPNPGPGLLPGESNRIDLDVNSLATDPVAQALRDGADADIVILLTDAVGNGGNYGGIFGIVEAIGPNDNTSYAIVETGAATTGRFTFAHEIAHLFGGGHDSDPRPGIPHGHNFKTGNFLPCIFGKRQRTILNTAGANDVRIQHYSNPNVKFDDKKTGKDNERDNAQQLRGEACVVAQFRETVEPFSVIIGGERFGCPCQGASINSTIFGGTAGATYNYDWFVGDDGINWNPLPYNGPNALVNLPCIEGDGVFVRVEVVGSDGNTDNSSAFIEAATEWPGQVAPCMMFLGNGGNLGGSGSDFSIMPNPAQGPSELIFKVHETDQFSIRVMDMNGKIVNTILDRQELDTGIFRFPLNISDNGIFFIQSIDSQGKQSTIKFIKL